MNKLKLWTVCLYDLSPIKRESDVSFILDEIALLRIETAKPALLYLE